MAEGFLKKESKVGEFSDVFNFATSKGSRGCGPTALRKMLNGIQRRMLVRCLLILDFWRGENFEGGTDAFLVCLLLCFDLLIGILSDSVD